MSWNPSIKFQLRDDQVAFGKLIFDKNGAELLSEFLIGLKNGNQVNMEVLMSIVNDWCFTDDEFEGLKVEFEKIKEDIATFKSLTSSFGSRWTASIQSVGIAADYVAGTSTWIEKYKENKRIAASLYQDLKRRGHHFDSVKEMEYDKRYFDVVSSCTETELVESFLQKQYREDMLNGDPDALQKYIDALVETGCMSKEAAEKKLQLMRHFDSATANAARSNDRKRVQREQENFDNTVHSTQKSEEKLVHVNWDLVREVYQAINNIKDDPAAQDSAMSLFYDIMFELYKAAELMEPFTNITIDSSEKLWSKSKELFTILSKQVNKGLIDTAEYMIPQEKFDTVAHYYLAASDNVTEDYSVVTARLLKRWGEDVTRRNDSNAIRIFIDIARDAISQAGLSVPTAPGANSVYDVHTVISFVSDNAETLDAASLVAPWDKVLKMLGKG